MSLWVDKHRPPSLDKLDFHPLLSQQIKHLVTSNDVPHMLVYGPSGAGKKTRIMCLLKELYGPGIEKMKIDRRVFTTPSKSKIELTTISSNYHIEINPSDAGNNDRLIIQDVLKEIAQSQQLDSQAQKSFKIVVLSEVDMLTKDAQHALRRTMEKYVSTCRLILCTTNVSKVLSPIRSRCLCLRVPAPDEEEVIGVLNKIAAKENITIPREFAVKLAATSNRNLRKAILSLEASKVNSYPFNANGQVMKADWELYLQETARSILSEQNPHRLMEVRGRLYELLSHCIPPSTIMKSLCEELVKNLDSGLKVEVISWAAFYEHRIQCGTKAIYHLEAFVVKFMSIYKNFLTDICA
eukprot:Nk52_evm73s554 gene=Nk52_evmTU73s554